LDLIGFVDRIYDATYAIDFGRKGFAIRGKAEEGRISYETGISLALSTFRDAQSTIDPHTIILAEFTFLNQELQFCEETDIDSISSLTQAIQSFDDAFLSLEVVVDSAAYQSADKTHPHSKKYRINGFPKDAFHIACIAHRTRLQNILRAPGIDPIEKTLLKQRFANLATAQSGYIEKQKKVMGNK
jgi:hypothetical protein